jgi:hypothetical protein
MVKQKRALTRVKHTKLTTNERQLSRNPNGQKQIDTELLDESSPPAVEAEANNQPSSNACLPLANPTGDETQPQKKSPDVEQETVKASKLLLSSSIVENLDGTVTIQLTTTREELENLSHPLLLSW